MGDWTDEMRAAHAQLGEAIHTLDYQWATCDPVAINRAGTNAARWSLEFTVACRAAGFGPGTAETSGV